MKTVLVTGSTDGIGKATTQALAKGCRVIMHGPDDAQARCAHQELISATANPNLQAVSADFSSLA
jgi:NAD(P)-dependent dehydrogenase (short-subunit alcohol dehydrogenase family)